MEKYLSVSEFIDWDNLVIKDLANELASGLSNDADIVKKCFEWVRDEIKHSADYQLNPVTCKASEVLKYKTGYCYAKSHLLAALLRANKIPAGLCYQRLCIDKEEGNYCLHGLNAVYLHKFGWYRIDARGNKKGISARFNPPVEQLAFVAKEKYEADLPEIWSEPLPIVIGVLQKYKDYITLNDNLPDIELIHFERL